MTIAANLKTIKKLLAEYEEKYGREPGSVQLLAVSKRQPIAKIVAAFAAGAHAFGESYVQEALQKIAALADKPIEWHFIGPIQRNKTRKIAEHFAWVHSVDTIQIAKRLNDQRPPQLPPLNVCIEINLSDEPSKSGVTLQDALPLAQFCLTQPKLNLRGLMAIPAPQQDFSLQRAQFHDLWLLAKKMRAEGIALDTLSMGMSDDFEAAIAEGATIIRIGTGIFGQR